jgi:ABC1 atypical kinase-like domain
MRREWAQPIGSAAVSWRRCYCRWYAAIAAVALLFGRPIEAFSPGSSRITPGRLSAQSPCLSQYAASSCSRSRSSPALHLSLDDNWEQVAENLIAKARLINWNDLATNTVNDLRWNKVFSKEWFAAIERGVVEFAVGVTHLPVVNQVELVVLPTLFIVLASLYRLSFPDVNYRSGMEPYPRGVYDARAAQTYYSRRKRLVLQRALQLLRLSNRFLIGLAIDKYITRKEEENRPLRAKQLLALITDLGPTAIKVGQALSVRPDLIPAEYAATLSTLQDQVPPFSTTAAKQLLRQELGEERYQNLGLGKSNGSSASGSTSSKNGSGPVASASIGQVYKGQLNGMDVAIKVQRPNVLAEIALDLYIVREFAPIYQRITKSGTNLQALANEWGRGFIAELDYREEAAATMRFNDAMQARQLTAVCAPIVVPDYSTEQILVTQWVDGTRLDQSNSGDNGDDIPRLCAVALNAYLVMLLELKSLHCDPHPVRIRIICVSIVYSVQVQVCVFELLDSHVFLGFLCTGQSPPDY